MSTQDLNQLLADSQENNILANGTSFLHDHDEPDNWEMASEDIPSTSTSNNPVPGPSISNAKPEYTVDEVIKNLSSTFIEENPEPKADPPTPERKINSPVDLGLQFLSRNLKNPNLMTDVGNITYTNGEQRLSSLTPISEPFCDSIIMVKFCNASDWVDDYPKLCKEHLQKEFGKLTPTWSQSHYVTACEEQPIPFQNDTPRSNGAREIARGKNISEMYENQACMFYKVDLADVMLETILERMPKILQELETNHFFLLDLDITQDFAGVFNKSEISQYLIDNFNFCKAGEGEVNENYKIIRDDDANMGIDCLTWTHSNSRVKIYNKFICQMTSPGVRNVIGNHIVDFIDCPSKRLRKTFSSDLAKKHGITRLEASIYNYSYQGSAKQFEPLLDCKTVLKKNKTYLKNSPLYSVPISKMWQKLTDSLRNSCCVVDKEKLRYVYWVNGRTKKFTGVEIRLPSDPKDRQETIDYALSKFGFNELPINHVEMTEDEQYAKKVYIKTGETYFTRSAYLKSTISPRIDIASTGLINTRHVIAQVRRENSFREIRIIPMPVEPQPTARVPSSPNQNTSPKKRKFDEAEDTKNFILKPINSIETKQTFGNATVDLFFQNWTTLKEKAEYTVYACVFFEKETYCNVSVLAQEEGDESKKVYRITGSMKQWLIDSYNGLVCEQKNGGNGTKGMSIMYAGADQPIVKFKTGGTAIKNGYEYALYESFEFCANANGNGEN